MSFLLAVVLLAAPAPAQPLPDAADLLKQSQDAMRNHRSVQFESDMVVEMMMGASPMKMNITASLAIKNPGKMRAESKMPMGTSTMISDGESTWMYFSMLKQYTKVPAARGLQGVLEASGIRLPDPSKSQGRPKTLREETIEVDGAKHDCWVVETTIDRMPLPAPPGAELSGAVFHVWIDKSLKMDLKTEVSGKMQGGAMPAAIEFRQSLNKHGLKLDAEIPDSTFAFTPPADAKEVPQFAGMEPPNLAGKPAPAFQVKALDGKAYELASLKGKVLLLDFWTTWCGPCRREAPMLEKLQRQFRDKDLVVLGINVGEDRETIEKFLKEVRVSFPIAQAGNGEVIEEYRVSAFPTYVVIGRDGTIAAHQIGGSGEAKLYGLLEKAGLKLAPKKEQ